MNRYFIEVSYHGGAYAGFQVQKNAHSVQAEVEKVLATFLREPVELTGSSRTDTGVHALQNYFHFDIGITIEPRAVYNLNSMLPTDVVVRSLRLMKADAHCRFDAISREYRYYIHSVKNPFLNDRAFYYPYKLDVERLNEAAAVIMEYGDFGSFCKRGSQVKTTECRIVKSYWEEEGDCLVYTVRANRFLRGMVRGLVGTQLQVGRGKMSVQDLREVIEAGDNSKADFAVPGKGLFLIKVEYEEGYFG